MTIRYHPKYADLLIAKKLASVYSRVFLAHPTNPVEGCADANPKLLLNDT